MTVHKLVEKDILFCSLRMGIARYIKTHYICGSSLSWYSAERGFSGVPSAGVLPSRTPWGDLPRGPPWASWGLISNNGTAVLCLAASPQLHGGEGFSLAFIGAAMQCCA